jgi:hypothetical protein
MDNHLKFYATQIKICESSLKPEVRFGSGESEEVVHSLSYNVDVKCKTLLSVLGQISEPQSIMC